MHFIFIACNKNKNVYRTDPSFIYRCENLALGLQKDKHTSEFIHLKEFKFSKKIDIVIFHRPKFSLRLWLIIHFLKIKKIFFMVDIDDFIFDKNFADQSPAFKNNILSLRKIKKQFSSNLQALKLFTNISVSTDPLKEHILKLLPSSNIIIIPNTVHQSWEKIKMHEKDFSKKIISYFPGTKSHDKDFETIRKPLTKFLQNNPDILLKITGPLNFNIDIPREQILYNQKVPFNEHWKNYENIWINLAPLEISIFNKSKSALKVIEAGFFNTPTISIDNSDTKRFIDKGALIMHTEKDLYTFLEKSLNKGYYEILTNHLKDKVFAISNNRISAQKLIKFIDKHIGIQYARQRRKDGLYNIKTLRYYLSSWRRTKDINIYVEYCMFCRDLGYLLSPPRKILLQNILNQLQGKSKKNANLLLMETNSAFTTTKQYIKDIFNNQNQLHTLFNNYLQNKKICAVGNAATIRQKELGNKIDTHDIVLRFNNCCSSKEYLDLGHKTSIWVSAPNINNIINSPWIIVSGPNMLYRGAKWKRFTKLNLDKINILTVPLKIWKELVSLLHAPPSSGILILYWFKVLCKNWDTISIVGFDLTIEKNIYHYADDNHKAGRRHNWEKEKKLIKQWINEGLQVLK